MPKSPKNNPPMEISEHHKKLYQDMLDGEYEHAIVSCVVDGVESAVISAVGHDEKGELTILPLFVAVTESMHLIGPGGDDLQELYRGAPITWN